jgi:hypothetical protein
MNQDDVQWIEQQMEKMKQLYQRLRDCFEKERNALIQVEIDSLWGISSEKDEVCNEINTVKNELTETAVMFCPEPSDLNQLLTVLPKTCRSAFSESVRQIQVLKKEIDILRQQNMRFINESLQFMDQMMAMISGTGNDTGPAVYNRQCALNSRKPVRFLRQEV